MSLRPQSSGQCPVNITVPSFTSFFYLYLVQKMKSWAHRCQWQKLERAGVRQVLVQGPQSSSPGVTFVSVPSSGLTLPSNGFLLKELVNSVNLPPWDRLVLSAPMGCNCMHRNLLKPLHEGWAQAGNTNWFLALGPFGCLSWPATP